MPNSRNPHTPATFKLRVLGGLSLLAVAGPAAGQQRRRLALLAVLASARERGVRRDRLIALLSPESSTESARHSLHQLLYYLRRQLGDDAFLGTDPLRLNPAIITADVSEFEDAIDRGDHARAAAVYSGPFLDGFHLDLATFEEWVASERLRLTTMHAEAIHRLALDSEATGDRTSTLKWWRQLAMLDPLSGSAALGFMRALVATGDASAAVRHARGHVALVRTELGVEPNSEIQALAASLQSVAPAGAAPPRTVHRLALLPLRTTGADSSARLVAEGLTREMISTLTRNGIAVIGHESVAAYTTPGASLRQIGRALDADAIATGALVWNGGSIELALEVANPQSGENLWAHTTRVDSARISRLASDAAGALGAWILGSEAVSRGALASEPPRTSPEAYTDYLLGMREMHRGTSSAMSNALEVFENAIVRDSDFALPHAGLGMALTVAVDYAILPADEAFRRAEPMIARSLALDPSLALAHLARARLLQLRDWDWKGAEAEYLAAIALEPNAQSYQTYGWFLEWYVGRADEGVAMGERAVELEPGSAWAHAALAWRLRGANRLDRAATEARIALALDSTAIDGHWILAEIFLRRGELAEAELSARRYIGAGGDVPANRTTLGEILARTGRTAEATAYAKRLALLATRDGPSLVALARTEVALGHHDRALTLLERAVREHVFTIPFQPYWDPIRDDRRFSALLRAQGLA